MRRYGLQVRLPRRSLYLVLIVNLWYSDYLEVPVQKRILTMIFTKYTRHEIWNMRDINMIRVIRVIRVTCSEHNSTWSLIFTSPQPSKILFTVEIRVLARNLSVIFPSDNVWIVTGRLPFNTIKHVVFPNRISWYVMEISFNVLLSSFWYFHKHFPAMMIFTPT